MDIEFIFSDETLISLTKTLSTFPKIEDAKRRPTICFNHTINNVSLQNLESLLRVCSGKIEIDISGANLENIFKRSVYASLLVNKNSDNLSKSDNEYIFQLLN